MERNIILGCMYFSNLCGTEMYYYELAKAFGKMGYKVFLITNPHVGQMQELILKEKTQDLFKVVPATTDLSVIMQHAKLVICSHIDIIKRLLQAKAMYNPQVKFVTVHHSEVYTQEQPYIDDKIDLYVGIRPEIAKMLACDYGLKNSKLIWNPFDILRYKPRKAIEFQANKANRILFCGSLNEIRRKCMDCFASVCKQRGWKMIIVGEDINNVHNELLKKHGTTIEYYHPTAFIEDFVLSCDATCGVLIGRTTIEGWLLGKPAFVFDVNSSNDPIGFEFMEPPTDLDKFNSIKIAEQFLQT